MDERAIIFYLSMDLSQTRVTDQRFLFITQNNLIFLNVLFHHFNLYR